MAHGFLQSFDKRIRSSLPEQNRLTRINPTAVKVMKEAGIDISNNKPKNVDTVSE